MPDLSQDELFLEHERRGKALLNPSNMEDFGYVVLMCCSTICIPVS